VVSLVHIGHQSSQSDNKTYRWDWCAEHNVQLPDEYDQLASDLEVFWALRPSEMRAVQQDWEKHGSNTFTIGKSAPNAPLKKLACNANHDMRSAVASRSRRQMKIIRPIAHLLPAFRATWTGHDGQPI